MRVYPGSFLKGGIRSARHALAVVVLLSQALFGLASLGHVHAVQGWRSHASPQPAPALGTPVAAAIAPADDAASCPICLAQNLDRGLAAVPVLPPVTEAVSVGIVRTDATARFTARAAFHRSRAPPART